jgi:hypothetical protein
MGPGSGREGRRHEQALERRLPAEPRIASQKNITHPATAQPVKDHIGADETAGRQIQAQPQ